MAEFVRRLARPEEGHQTLRPVGGEVTLGCIIRDGYLAYSWGDPTARFGWYSASKPVLATLLFFAVQRGHLESPQALIADQGWSMSEKDRTMNFFHLTNMISGYGCAEKPGDAWAYNDFAIHLLSLSLERAFKQPLNDAAVQCFAPLELECERILGPDNHKGHGVTLAPLDFARIGWLWINRGEWAGRTVLPRAFFDNYMRPQVPRGIPKSVTPDNGGDDYLGIGSYGGGFNQKTYGGGTYGYAWWFNGQTNEAGNLNWPDAPADTFAAMGYGGNIMVMIPSKRLVVAARGNWSKSRPKVDTVSETLKLLMEAMR